jgi:hypothetical protein
VYAHENAFIKTILQENRIATNVLNIHFHALLTGGESYSSMNHACYICENMKTEKI